MAQQILHNGNITDKTIGIDTESLFFNYGFGLFETILYRDERLHFFAEHIQRVLESVESLGRTVDKLFLDEAQITSYVKSLNFKTDDIRVKIVLIDDGKDDLSVVVNAFEYTRKTDNFSVWIDSQVKDLEISNYKSVNYMHNLMRRELFTKKAGVQEVLFLNKKERLLEGSYTNIAVVLNGNIYFVEKSENYLGGVMQQQVEKNFKELGFKKAIYKRRGFSTKMLRQCDEVILLNSLQVAVTVEKIYNQKKDKIIVPKTNGYSKKIREFFLK